MAAELRDFSTFGTRNAHRGETGFLAALAGRALAWDARYRQRRRLADLTDEMLRDIGVSRGDAAVEARKSFWHD